MKTILILTDFSENSAHAAKAAVNLAEKMHANMLLFHNYQVLPVTANYGAGPWAVDEGKWIKDESNKNLAELEKDLTKLSKHIAPGDHKPTINCTSDEGDLGDNVKGLLGQKNIELIVMGARSDNAVDHVFFGSEINTVLRYATCPVLILPLKDVLKKLNPVTFATDFDEADIDAIHYLVKLGKLFNYELDIVHVHQPDDLVIANTEKKNTFLTQVSGLKYPHVNYHEIQGKDVVHRLNRYCEEKGTAVLAMVNRRHSFFTRLFQQSSTKKALADQTTTLMIFPSKTV
jgi:nucleotide-binding universal stress UspA family protein